MISTNKTIGIDIKPLLSTLWIFVLFNIIFRDIHDLFRPGFLEEMMTGIVNGNQITDEVLLMGGIIMDIPISMVLLSRILNYRLNRWANIFAGGISIAVVISNGTKDLDDIFFVIVEVVSLLLIVFLAWKWQKQEI